MTKITANRAVRMSRFDGCGAIGGLLGTCASDWLTENFTFVGNYLVGLSCSLMALLWMIFYVRDPPPRVETADSESECEEPTETTWIRHGSAREGLCSIIIRKVINFCPNWSYNLFASNFEARFQIV